MINLFVYGTLMFPQVMTTLTGLTPTYAPAVARNTARFSIRNQVYPGLVNRSGNLTMGYLIRNLDEVNWHLIKAFEGNEYSVGPVAIETQQHNMNAYTFFVHAHSLDIVANSFWNPESFLRYQLESFLADCRAFKQTYRHHSIDAN